MNRIGHVLLNISVALYLFANGILGFTADRGEFGIMVRTIFGRSDVSNIITIVLSVCAIAAGILLLFELFRVEVPVTDVIIMVFVIIWLLFIVLVDIINPVASQRLPQSILDYLRQLAAHLLVLGALLSAVTRTRR